MEEGIEPRLQSLRSRILLTITSVADGEQISCRGDHPALSDALTALVASVTISVLRECSNQLRLLGLTSL